MPRTDAKDELRREIQAWAKCLRRDFPVSRPTRVYLRDSVVHEDGSELRGRLFAYEKHFTIVLKRSKDWHAVHDSLIEEWTHARCYPNDLHDVHYDLEYGIIQRKYRGE